MYGRANILVIDDDEAMRDACRQTLSKDGNRVEVAEDGLIGLAMLQKESFDLVIVDLKMPGMSGIQVLDKVKQEDPDALVIVITGYGSVESAVEAMRKGAYDFVSKPFTPEALRIIVRRVLETRQIILENVLLRAELGDSHEPEVIIGQSQAMKEVEDTVLKVGPTGSTVLISGESGTGKELVARAIHLHSQRKTNPFVVVDCGSLVENLFESELFGHVKGSFTGAIETKYGRFELANGGTLFLDEIGNTTRNIQIKLLRVLQEQEITKVGSSQVVKVDVRIIAATNKDLQEAVRKETFREDLFYRLSVVPLTLPPLRARKGDIPLLANYFVRKYNKKRKKNVKGISDLAMKSLTEYDWPGNVRELENAIERAVVLTGKETIEPADLRFYGLAATEHAQSAPVIPRSLDEAEREHILRIFEFFGRQVGKTADALQIDRKTLRLKLRKYGVNSND